MLKRVEQKSFDDCSICVISTITGESYDNVHEAAKLCGYIFGSGTGVSLGHVILKLGYRVSWLDGFHDKPNSIISVDSLYRPEGKHAIIHHKGLIIDPSRGDKHVTLDHAIKTASYTYFDIRVDDD